MPFDTNNFLATVSQQSGVYQMIDSNKKVLYVGKAKNLKKRLSSYFHNKNLPPKTQMMVAKIAYIETTVTHTETEALLLESNLIKTLKPRYNIVFRDDKNYPYIYLSDDPFPRISVHYGARKGKGQYFGPYIASNAVRESIQLLQKLFLVRQCENSIFRHRSRPCLQYQIKRCRAPCVHLISAKEYQEDVRHTIMFLTGKSSQVIDEQVQQMDLAVQQLNFERAAILRDQITYLRRVQETQHINAEKGDMDIIALHQQEGLACMQLFVIRQGQTLGNRSYFFPFVDATLAEEAIHHFIGQVYLADHAERITAIPPQIIISHVIDKNTIAILQQALSQHTTIPVQIITKTTLKKTDTAQKHWLIMAENNAKQALMMQLSNKVNMHQRFLHLQQVLELPFLPRRLECFDISHTQGEATMASCVVFALQGAIKSEYRRFHITDITPGDDYAAMSQVLLRRYQHYDREKLPDIVFIDGGKGQLQQAKNIMQQLSIKDVILIGIAKGAGRKAGLEKLVLSNKREIILASDAKALHLILHLRDEAHRFAIYSHRQKRDKMRKQSVLEEIAGIGSKKKQLLLKQFGGLQGIMRAGIEDLMQVKGIHYKLAEQIYNRFHK